MAERNSKMHDTWRNQEDVMDDIWALSEMEGIGSREIEEPTPPTILEYRAQMAANNRGSIYDTPDDSTGNPNYRLAGVGRGRFGSIVPPGLSEYTDRAVTEEVKRKIRQVAGLGYSNTLIEQGVRAMTMAREAESPAGSASQRSPTRPGPSGVSSPYVKSVSSSSLASTSSYSDAVEEPRPPPPPLSVMRKRAEEERLKKKQSSATRTESPPKKNSPKPSPSNSSKSACQSTSSGTSSDEGSWRRRDGNSSKSQTKEFSLNCNDFPPLK